MAGLDGRWKHLLAISCALTGACQRLEYVSDDDGGELDEGGSDDAADSHDPDPDDDDVEDVPVPKEDPVCVVRTLCECYGAPEQDFCEPAVREMCSRALSCDGLDPAMREDCVVGYFCDVDGHFEGDTLVCDPPETCAGACDLDPAACDEDGDGVLTFSCNGAQECEHGQFCVALGEDWGCDENCSNCNTTGGGVVCVSPSPACEGDTWQEQRGCVADLECEFWVEWYSGYEITCGDNECHG